ncbi:hypothetical protein PQX77_021079 [Marasmius sp. AFHP31]|nr:hypothetical protein PQX77_021079 [Marasmius sp. AFHP31]
MVLKSSSVKEEGRTPVPTEPTLKQSWEAVTTEASRLDDGLVRGWKEDIDTLLVFAGLFSTIVAGFTIESSKWLEESPEDKTVALLVQISNQLSNTTIPRPQIFKPSPSAVRINTMWFVSLIVALVNALLGLLCRQWLATHSAPMHRRSSEEALALHWLRHQSLKQWRARTFIAFLPVLLKLALFLFLGGLLEMLWTLHPVPFVFAASIVGIAGLVCQATTYMPAIDIIRQAIQITPRIRLLRDSHGSTLVWPDVLIRNLPPIEYVCPYKSPQAWGIFRLFRSCLHIPYFTRALYFLCRKEFTSEDSMLPGSQWALEKTLRSLSSWSRVDLEAIKRSEINRAPSIYVLNALRWQVAELRDSPIMLIHLQKILESMPLHLVMPAVLDQWYYLPDREWDMSDVAAALRTSDYSLRGIENHISDGQQKFLADKRKTSLYDQLLRYNHLLMHAEKGDEWVQPPLVDILKVIWDQQLQREFPSICYPVPFYRVHGLLKSPGTTELGIRLGSLLTSWVHQNMQTPDDLKAYLTLAVNHLAQYIVTSSPDYALHAAQASTSFRFVDSQAGVDFFAKMHTVIHRGILAFGTMSVDETTTLWTEAMDIVRRVRGLSEDYFPPLPGHFPLPLSKLEEALCNNSPTDAGLNFNYLSSFQHHWDQADSSQKHRLAEILSNHINGYPHSDPDVANNSPLVTSREGSELICLVHVWQVQNQPNSLTWNRAFVRVQASLPVIQL